MEKYYDERQILYRGRAAYIAFLTALIMMTLTWLKYFCSGSERGVFEMMILSILVPLFVWFLLVAVWDAFDGITGKGRGMWFGVLWAAIGIEQLVIGVINSVRGHGFFFERNVTVGNSYCFILALFFLSVSAVRFTATTLRRVKEKREISSETESSSESESIEE